MHLRMAQRVSAPEARASHLELAALWTRLAAQADHQIDIGPEFAGEADELPEAALPRRQG
ncbi:hypothetical protein DJ017_15910 [Phenylobacterium soli]|uniref:Uncharacterized protein n=2 Tax=Phenylobacterium soli TaxID=2170551 RepID=A0A328AQU8_9CAUL|nr:hypothetical protein DJ017_15910 [Phenylobacterium soli]